MGGRALVPATAFFELAAAAAAAVTADGPAPPATEATALTAVAILGSKVLQPARSAAGVSGSGDRGTGVGNGSGSGHSGRESTPSAGGGNVLACEVQPVSGQLKIASLPAVGQTSAVPHVTCRCAKDRSGNTVLLEFVELNGSCRLCSHCVLLSMFSTTMLHLHTDHEHNLCVTSQETPQFLVASLELRPAPPCNRPVGQQIRQVCDCACLGNRLSVAATTQPPTATQPAYKRYSTLRAVLQPSWAAPATAHNHHRGRGVRLASNRSDAHSIAAPLQGPCSRAGCSVGAFSVDPAVADAVLHLGAVHVPEGSGGESRVPVGVAAYLCSRPLSR